MNWRNFHMKIGVLGAIVALSAPVLAVVYTWDAGASDDNWTSFQNWHREFSILDYPNDNNDDAHFPAGSWTAILDADLTIDELSVSGSLTLNGPGGLANKTLQVNVLTISGGAGAAHTMTVGTNAVIETY
jgi:hypothetical protein